MERKIIVIVLGLFGCREFIRDLENTKNKKDKSFINIVCLVFCTI